MPLLLLKVGRLFARAEVFEPLRHVNHAMAGGTVPKLRGRPRVNAIVDLLGVAPEATFEAPQETYRQQERGGLVHDRHMEQTCDGAHTEWNRYVELCADADRAIRDTASIPLLPNLATKVAHEKHAFAIVDELLKTVRCN